jgi:hypothetical protein
VTWLLIGLVTAWMIVFFFTNLLECFPISEAFVNAPGLGGNPQCIDAIPMYLSQVYSDVVLDVLILVIPIPLVWKLRLPLRQKLGVMAIFLLGGMYVELYKCTASYTTNRFSTVLASCAKLIVFTFVGSGECFYCLLNLNLANVLIELQKQADVSCRNKYTET